MKKIISLILSISIVIAGLPMMVYAMDSTPEISLDEFTEQLNKMQSEYDDNYIGEIKIENGNEFYFVNGEKNILSNLQGDVLKAIITKNDFEIPISAISDYCDLPETSTYSLDNDSKEEIIDKETAEDLGFEVEIKNDTAVITQPYQTERLIVKSKYDINKLDSVDIVEGYNDLHIVQFDNQESAKQAEEYYNNQKLIEYAEPDVVISTMNIEYTTDKISTTSSQNNHLSWGSEAIGIDDYIDYLGDTTNLPEIVVGIIDTGIDLDHEFLQDRIIETSINLSDSGTENCEDDDNGHGTHVAGIVTDNTTENVKLKSFKCLNSNGNGSLSSIVLAIDYAVKSKVNVINMSLGARTQSSTMENSVNQAVDSGIVVCVAAGNSGANASNFSPAGIESCITVGAFDSNDQLPYWTNWGSSVDILSPGVSIYSSYFNNDYKTLSGTSMASPFVAAASALVLLKNMDATPQQVQEILQSNALPYPSSSRFENIKALYIGTISEYNSERTITPKISVESGKYLDNINVEITCDDENADIYYTIDGSRATIDNGTLYTEPITVDRVTSLHAVAYSPNKIKSLQAYADYYIVYTDADENFEIDSNGIVTAYNGTNNYLKIPDTIAGITVTGIGADAFNQSNIIMIKFPDTLTYIGERAFYFCRYLYSVDAKNIKHIAQYAFARCTKLEQIDLTQAEVIEKYGCYDLKSLTAVYNDKITSVESNTFAQDNNIINIDLPNVKQIDVRAFASVYYLESINLPNVETIGKKAFDACTHIESIELKNATFIDEKAFNYCRSLKNIYIPNVVQIKADAFYDITKLETVFAPSLIETESLPLNDGTTLYLSDKFKPSVSSEYNYTIIAPTNSYAEQWANENGHTFISSDSRDKSVKNPSNVADLGRSICTSVAGLRFGFTWNNISEIESLANDVEYGFIYSQKGAEDLSIETVDGKNVKKALAPNRVENDGTTSFNLVISNIPTTYYDREITARAYVCIDGMYFYSNMLKGSFKEVAGLVLADNEIDQTTKNAIKNLLAKEA